MRILLCRYMAIFAITAAFVYLALQRCGFPTTGIDDANIFFVYAKNLAEGHGFVYNVGGERVEGFTSLLWVLICSAAFGLAQRPEIALLIVNTLVVSLGVTIAVSYIEPGERPRSALPWQALFLALLYSAPNFVIWTTVALMENAVWCTCLISLTFIVLKDGASPSKTTNPILCLGLCLLLLTRPEAMLWGLVFITLLWVGRVPQRGFLKASTSVAAPLLAYASTLAALTTFRLLYFGYPLPNTYYAKVSPSLFYNLVHGFAYLARYLTSDWIVALAVLCIVILASDFLLDMFFLKLRIGAKQGLRPLALIGLIALLIPVLNGGDHFTGFRFYQSPYPIFVLVLVSCLRSAMPALAEVWRSSTLPPLKPKRAIFITVSAGLFILFIGAKWHSITYSAPNSQKFEFAMAKKARIRGAFCTKLFVGLPAYPSIGDFVAGGIKLTYAGPVIDLMGLNNTIMAHNGGSREGVKNHAAFEKSTFYELSPDIVTPVVVKDQGWEFEGRRSESGFANNIFRGLFRDAQFQNAYVYAKVNSKAHGNTALAGWFTKEFAERLDTEDSYNIEFYKNSNKRD